MKRIILVIVLFLGILSYSEEESGQKSKIEVNPQNETISDGNNDKNMQTFNQKPLIKYQVMWSLLK